jgi:hypothetical protein
MKNIKYLFVLFFSTLTFVSCFDDETGLELNDEGPNVAGFTNTRESISRIASGAQYQIELKMKVEGPSTSDLTGDVTVTYAATSASTAIEGVHYKLTNPTATLTKANNYLGWGSFTMLTAGIDAPLAGPSPILVLQATTTTGDGTVIANGKPVQITLNYACFSNLAGNYTETTQYYRGGVFQGTTTRPAVITQTGEGTYRTSDVGHWTQAALGGTPGYTFYDICDTIDIPGQNLVDTYSNWVEGVPGASSVDPDTGIITVEYTIVVPPATSDRVYYTTYVPN